MCLDQVWTDQVFEFLFFVFVFLFWCATFPTFLLTWKWKKNEWECLCVWHCFPHCISKRHFLRRALYCGILLGYLALFNVMVSPYVFYFCWMCVRACACVCMCAWWHGFCLSFVDKSRLLDLSNLTYMTVYSIFMQVNGNTPLVAIQYTYPNPDGIWQLR